MVVFACASLSLGACAGNPNFVPVSTDVAAQRVEANPRTGTPFVKSKQATTIVALQQVHNDGLEQVGTLFDLKAALQSGEEIDFGPANIQVRQGNRTCEVLGYEQAVAKIKRIENTKQAINAFAMILGGVAAGYGLRTGGVGGAAAVALFPVTVMSATTNIQRSSADIESFNDESSQVFLTNVKFRPNSQIGGLFAVEGLSSAEPTQVTISIGNDVHDFTFQPVKSRR